MAIRIEHGKPTTLLTAAQMKGEEIAARQQLERNERLQAQQREFEYRTAIRQQDMAIDIQMQERAKAWEIEKMELRSRLDFAREEQLRQRKLDSIDSAMQQIDKEVLAGRISEKEAYPIKQKLGFDRMGVDVPVSMLRPEKERYGVAPYWMEWRGYPEGSPERQLYETKMAQGISGIRTGTVPYHLDPVFLRSLPSRTAQDILADKGIFFDSDEEFEAFLGNLERTGAPTTGITTGEQVRVISPTGEEGTIPIEDLEEALAEGYTQVPGDTPEGIPEGISEAIPPTTKDVMEQLEAGERKFYKPSLRTFATMSPLRYLMERRKAKKIVR